MPSGKHATTRVTVPAAAEAAWLWERRRCAAGVSLAHPASPSRCSGPLSPAATRKAAPRPSRVPGCRSARPITGAPGCCRPQQRETVGQGSSGSLGKRNPPSGRPCSSPTWLWDNHINLQVSLAKCTEAEHQVEEDCEDAVSQPRGCSFPARSSPPAIPPAATSTQT